MRVALLSPYHGGSHAAWAQGWTEHSRHEIRLLSLPSRFWKWRMHGAAVTLARRWREVGEVDCIVATDMLDLAAFLGLTRERTAGLPTLLYMHENQVTYPLPRDPAAGPMRRQHGERDRHYGFVNLTSMLAADRVAFNSAFHRDELLPALRVFLRHYPDHREVGRVRELADRCVVLPVGLHLADLPSPEPSQRSAPPTVVWNQRWEYDKNPEGLMRVLVTLAEEGVDFRVALCGEQFGRRPAVLRGGIAALGERVSHAGHLPRADYASVLGQATVVVSTAWHEFFGVAVLEAMAAGALPLLPRRLVYPEVLPEAFHDRCLYDDETDLTVRLREELLRPAAAAAAGAEIARAVRERFAWERLATVYDDLLEELPVQPQARG